MELRLSITMALAGCLLAVSSQSASALPILPRAVSHVTSPNLKPAKARKPAVHPHTGKMPHPVKSYTTKKGAFVRSHRQK